MSNVTVLHPINHNTMLRIAGRDITTYNSQDESHAVFYQHMDGVIGEKEFDKLSEKEQKEVPAVFLVSTCKGNKNLPAIVLTTNINMPNHYLNDEEGRKAIIDVIDALRMVNVEMLLRSFDIGTEMITHHTEGQTVDLNALYQQAQAKAIDEYQQYVGAMIHTFNLYKGTSMKAMEILIEGETKKQLNDLYKAMKLELSTIEPKNVYTYIEIINDEDSKEIKDRMVTQVSSDGIMWAMEMDRVNGISNEPEMNPMAYKHQNESLSLIKSLFYLASTVNTQGEITGGVDVLPNPIPFIAKKRDKTKLN